LFKEGREMKKGKVKVAIMGVAVAFIIALVGWSVFSFIAGSININSDYTAQNTTSAISNNGGTVSNVLGIYLVMIAIIGITLGLFYFSSSVERFENLGKIGEFLISSAYYFGYGLLAIVIIVVPGYLIYLLYNYAILDGHAGDVLPLLKWIGLIILAFFGIAIIGYGFKKKIIEKFVKVKKESEYKVKGLPKAVK
jgi:hypothetical protein